jgi:hypothetical protein
VIRLVPIHPILYVSLQSKIITLTEKTSAPMPHVQEEAPKCTLRALDEVIRALPVVSAVLLVIRSVPKW